MRQLQQAGPKPVSAQSGDPMREGELMFEQEHCIGCHRIHGAGGKVGPDLSNEAGRKRSDAWLVGHFKNPAAFVKGSTMPATSNLNAAQLHSLTVYLQAQHGRR